MEINEVIRLGEEIRRTKEFGFSDLGVEFQTVFYILATLSVLIMGAALILSATVGNQYNYLFRIAILPLFIAMGIASIGVFNLKSEDKEKYEKEINDWKDDVVSPFMEALPKEKKEIVYIKIDPELSTKEHGFLFKESEEVQKTPIVVSYKDGGVVTITDWIPTEMKLTDNENPYIEIQKLEKDLGHGINAGVYNPKVYLSESYTFTDIK